MSDKTQHWNNMYSLPIEQIPWEITDAPKELVNFLESRPGSRGTALDVGCGTGNYSIYLAQHGYTVIGVDVAQKALDIATERAKSLNLPIAFRQGDVTALSQVVPGETFDLILDYSILHHIAPADVAAYAKQFATLLKPGGTLLLVCYSDQDEFSRGAPKATGKYGNDMYYRSCQEIEKIYANLRVVSYEEARLGKRHQHFAHSFIFEGSK